MLSEKIKALCANTDKLDELKDILSEVNALETQLENNKKTIDDMQGQIASLRDTNMKLFLSQTSEAPETEEPHEMTSEEAAEELQKIFNGGKE